MQKDEIVKQMASVLEQEIRIHGGIININGKFWQPGLGHTDSPLHPERLAQACYAIIEEMLPKWRQISEAPYATDLLVWSREDGVNIAKFKESNGNWYAQVSGEDALESEHEYWGREYITLSPTHWQPIPPQPEAE